MDSTPARSRRRGLAARSYAAIVVGLRHIIPLAWIVAAVAATVDAARAGQRPRCAARRPGRQGRQRREGADPGHAHVRLSPGHRHRRRPARPARPLAGRPAPPARRRARRPRPPRPGAQAAPGRHPAEQREGAHAVGRARHHGHHLPALRPRHEPRRRELGRAALRPADARRPPRRGRRRHRRRARAPGAVPRDRAGAAAHRGGQRGAHRPDRGPRLPLDRRPARGAGGRGRSPTRSRCACCRGWASAPTSRCPRRSSRSSWCSCSAWSPTTRSSSCPRRATGCARATSASQPHVAAVAEVAPIVVTAGLIVAAGTAALVVGHLQFFRAFGPGLAATTLITLAVSVTLVPALVALFGPRLFGARQLREQPPPPPDGDEGERRLVPRQAPAAPHATGHGRAAHGRARARAPDAALAPRAVAHRLLAAGGAPDRAHRHRPAGLRRPQRPLDCAGPESRPRAPRGRPGASRR